MKKYIALLVLASASLVLTGCVTSGYQGLIPGKDVHLKNFKQEITTPWGHTTTTADELDTVVRVSLSAPKGELETVPAIYNPAK